MKYPAKIVDDNGGTRAVITVTTNISSIPTGMFSDLILGIDRVAGEVSRKYGFDWIALPEEK